MDAKELLVSILQGVLFDLTEPPEIKVTSKGQVDRAGRKVWGATVTAGDLTIDLDIRQGSG